MNPKDNTPDFCPTLSRRDYFAAMAMQGLLASPRTPDHFDNQDIAEAAVDLAMFLIEELDKK